MSFSPSFPQGAPTLAEVLLSRTFARPPKPFADGDLLQALAHPQKPAEAAPSPDAVAKAAKTSGSSTYSSDARPGSASGDDASAGSSADGGEGRSVDVRV